MATLAADIPRIDVEAYRAQGFALVRGVFDRQTIARMRAGAGTMLERVAAAGKNVEVASGMATEKPVEGCPDQTEECGLANTGDRVKIRRLID